MFVRRTWKAKPLDEQTVAAFATARAASRVQAVLAHDSYLVNLASGDRALLDKSVDRFTDELERCDRLGIPLLVFHPGAPGERGEDWGLRTVATCLDEALRRTRGCDVRPCLETTAGQGTSLGWRLEQLAAVLDRVTEPERLAVCLDTQHVFAAGYDIASRAGYESTWEALAATVGVERLAALHLNDSKVVLGRRVDRHENIGEGELGVAPFERLVNDSRCAGLPGIVETPSETRCYREEVALLKSLRRAV